MRKVYGKDEAQLTRIFWAQTKRTAERRYARVRAVYVAAQPEVAQTYLAVFAWCYRFTPFTQDAQRRIRGKCPLELAGYDVSRLPMAQICRGQLLGWPPEALADVVPRA